MTLYHKRRRLHDFKRRRIQPSVSSSKFSRKHALRYQINLRTVLTAFYIGTGGYDIGSIACFLGINGGRSWERSFHRHSETIHSVILETTKEILDNAFLGEVEATIRDECNGKFDDDEINKFITSYKKKQYTDLPESLQRVGISVSYDMGWNKRSTGKIYDSLSGHGFMIGCRTGKVITYGVSKKKCS